MDKLVRFSELEGAVILAHDDEEIPPDECIHFNSKTLNNKTVVKYLEERKAVGSIFVKVFGLWVQTGTYVLQNHMQIVK